MARVIRTSSLSEQRPHSLSFKRGFSLLELIVVMSITSLLAGLLLPALSAVREHANRALCGSNQRQLGQALIMYGGSHNESLPIASTLDEFEPNPGELSKLRNAANIQSNYIANGRERRYIPEPLVDKSWDGLGRLYKWHYCGTPETFYCPSHEGEHTLDKCEELWKDDPSDKVLYSNYQYVGHKNWRSGKPISLLRVEKLILVTDGMRTKSDYNHGVGHNELRGDGSVAWEDGYEIRTQLAVLPPVDNVGLRSLDDLIYDLFFPAE